MPYGIIQLGNNYAWKSHQIVPVSYDQYMERYLKYASKPCVKNTCSGIATKYQNITRDFLIDKQVTNFEIIESQGATEGAIVNGIADVVVDISSTGETLKQNKLKVIEEGTLLRSSASIFVNKKYYKKNKSDIELKNFLAKFV